MLRVVGLRSIGCGCLFRGFEFWIVGLGFYKGRV